jgi:hypothetical protein
MHWDVRLTEANLVVADLIGAAMGRRPAEDDDEDTSTECDPETADPRGGGSRPRGPALGRMAARAPLGLPGHEGLEAVRRPPYFHATGAQTFLTV